MITTLAKWRTRCLWWLLRRRSHSFSYQRQRVTVHPCVINNRAHIVYPRGLQTNAPQLYLQLCEHYQRNGYALKEDQRDGSSARPPEHERRRWAPLLLFTTSMVFDAPLHADTGQEIAQPIAHHHSELRMVSNTEPIPGELGAIHASSALAATADRLANPGAAARIHEILAGHYQNSTADPDYVLSDFKLIANYYSQFAEILPILEALDNKNWKLVFDERTWATVASGTVFRVVEARVHFNTRAAAQLKLNNTCEGNPVCTASPADALLHELLHAHSMLVNTDEFLAQGGMSQVLYPYKHEYSIIEKERRLYASMSHVDDIKRPQRVDHTGRLVKAQCAICIQ